MTMSLTSSFAAMSLPRRQDAQDVQIRLVHAHAPQPVPVPPEPLYGVQAEGPQDLLELEGPAIEEVRDPLGALLGLEPLPQVRVLGGYPPGALPRVALLADRAAQRHQRCRPYVDGVRAQGYG